MLQMNMNPSGLLLKEYQRLLEHGMADELDELVNRHADEMGYAKVVWHIWRFRRFDALDPLREKLLERFNSGVALDWEALEVLYYLQEQRLTGNSVTDGLQQCPAIFRALCRSLSNIKTGRRQNLALNLVWCGLIDKDNVYGLPSMNDEDAKTAFGNMALIDKFLMECGRINRSSEQPIALIRATHGSCEWTAELEPKRIVEFYIGPYYFRCLDSRQLESACLPDTFESPFGPGLRAMVDFFLDRGWQVVPWLTWRGGLAPRCRGRGVFSFSYHTTGDIPGRWHYKFGHFSNLIQMDRLGYAGFSSLSSASRDEIMQATSNLDDAAVSKALEPFRDEYIVRRFTWRTQKTTECEPLSKGRTTVFFPLQDPLDEVASLAHLQPAEMIQVLMQSMGSDDRIYIKRHPVDKSGKTTELLARVEGDDRFFVTSASIHDLFAVSDYVVTVNSGVGFEAMLAGLPVIACGRSDYNIACATARTMKEFSDAINVYERQDPSWRNRFLYYYLAHHTLDPRNVEDFMIKLARCMQIE